jgi:hypothetical protein
MHSRIVVCVVEEKCKRWCREHDELLDWTGAEKKKYFFERDTHPPTRRLGKHGKSFLHFVFFVCWFVVFLNTSTNSTTPKEDAGECGS